MRILQSWRAVWSVVLLAFAGALSGLAQPRLVLDLNRERGRSVSQPRLGFEQDGVVYFSGNDPQHGYELWRTDGTVGGTYRLTDLCPGRCDGGGQALGFFQGSLYFLGNDSEHGTEIWRTDGTVGGEELLADVCPGICDLQVNGWVEWHGRFWFLAQRVFGTVLVLWSSDGTQEGTRPVASLCRDLSICEGQDRYTYLTGSDPSGQGLVLRVCDGCDASSLYRTDGTVGGTVLLHRYAARGSDFGEKATVPLYFLDGSDLWTSDGTPSGTRFVRNLDALVDYVPLRSSAQVIDGTLYLAFDGGEWLRSDGTAEGTVVLADVGPGTDPKIEPIGDAVFAVTSEGVWRTGGTPETTARLDFPFGLIQTVVARPGRLFGLSYEGQGAFVWTTDGTAAGTRRVHLPRGPKPDLYGLVGFLDGVLFSRGARELWQLEPIASGQGGTGFVAERLHEFQPENGGSGPSDQIVFSGRLLFASLANPESRWLYSSDGTAAGTTALRAIENSPYLAPGGAYEPGTPLIARAGARVFFNTAGALWSSDGTRKGTKAWRGSSFPSFRMNAPIGFLGGQLVFSATVDLDLYPQRCPPGEAEPWVSDGVRRMERLVNLNPFYYEPDGFCLNTAYSSSPGRGARIGPIALFAADDLVHGRELFATDGTKDGTRLVADIDPRVTPVDGSELLPRPLHFFGIGSDPSDPVRAGSLAFFAADDGTTGRELWVSDGTSRGTRQVADLMPGAGSSSPRDLVATGDAVYFFAANPPGSAGTAGEGLYRSDGTRRGTVRVGDLAGVSEARGLQVADGKLFFVAYRRETGTELWVSEGTAETTHEVTDLRPGPRGSAPQNLKTVGGTVIFAADDGVSGLEPWSSDGTAAGTLRWGDIAPGRDASVPGPFSVLGGQLLFGADDGEHGRELWAISLAELSQ
ncbi:MAG TPA: ELWxxDGT repeat protein [Thermoanaerobaculia bacterium]|jgi:ELWxxDGT repeat protein|nr:ELWxxDGT repeat protein [Thermoanaerobaculia bacterium]